jgi:hypothetical protein
LVGRQSIKATAMIYARVLDDYTAVDRGAVVAVV